MIQESINFNNNLYYITIREKKIVLAISFWQQTKWILNSLNQIFHP